MKWVTILAFLAPMTVQAQHTVALLESKPASFPAPALNQADLITIPIQLVNGLILAQAAIDGREGAFIVDTGAPKLLINATLSTSQEPVAAFSYNSPVAVTGTTVKSFSWGGVQYRDLEALAVDVSHLEANAAQKLMGLIGFDILQGYEVMFDYQNEQVVLCTPKKNIVHRTTTPVATISFTMENHLPIIEVTINGQQLRLGLDTGAGVNLMDLSLLNKLNANTAGQSQMESLQGLGKNAELATAAVIPSASIGNIPLEPMRFVFTDLSDLQAYTSTHIDGLLGYPFFEQLRCSINYQKQELYVWGR